MSEEQGADDDDDDDNDDDDEEEEEEEEDDDDDAGWTEAVIADRVAVARFSASGNQVNSTILI